MQTPPDLPGAPPPARASSNSNVSKGVLIGCGGCAVVCVLVLGFMGAVFYFVMSQMHASQPFQVTLQAAQASPEMREALGEPITLGWYFSGSFNWVNGEGTASGRIPLSGPKDSALVSVQGTSRDGEPWVFDKLEARIQSTRQIIDLRQP